MKKWILAALIIGVFQSPSYAGEEYFTRAEMIIASASKNIIPQAPRVSPDGTKLLYELFTKDKCEIWLSDAEGKNSVSLTGPLQVNKRLRAKVENAFWHPSTGFVAFNEMPEGIRKNGGIYVAKIHDNGIQELTRIDRGARPQFSKPYGRVIFYEYSQEDGSDNTLVYKILGRNPLEPMDNTFIELRGPIQNISKNVELSHPSLAPDGTTILFAARTAASGDFLMQLNITDIHRQRAYQLWQKAVAGKLDGNKIKEEISHCSEGLIDSDAPSEQIGEEASDVLTTNMKAFEKQATIVKGFTRKDFIIAWAMGLFGKLDRKYEKENQSLLYARIWMTDIFGAAIVPLADDASNVPLPQKWATVSKSGRFAVFEAGHFQNRHLYIVNMKSHKAVQLTNQGTYNSSPEISADEQWVYFESNRDDKKAIWRAKLDMEKIQKDLALE